ncbi:hypothetical protein [Actinoplanes sp. CA-252034]|uniref:hypothetical protein n=1 Tax=Actinoplanes sp. CA-252034 TaxID=3239906 RepID=UPI003D97B630
MTAIRASFRRWLYQHGRPNRLARILNRISALQFSSGKRAPRNWGALEVPGPRAPILRRYLAVAPGARPHMAVDPRAPLADFDRVAARYPVFHVTHDPFQETNNPAAVRTGSRLLGAGLILLGAAVATVAVLGPLVRASCATAPRPRA